MGSFFGAGRGNVTAKLPKQTLQLPVLKLICFSSTFTVSFSNERQGWGGGDGGGWRVPVTEKLQHRFAIQLSLAFLHSASASACPLGMIWRTEKLANRSWSTGQFTRHAWSRRLEGNWGECLLWNILLLGGTGSVDVQCPA